jgi:hypothetical protein
MKRSRSRDSASKHNRDADVTRAGPDNAQLLTMNAAAEDTVTLTLVGGGLVLARASLHHRLARTRIVPL